MFAAKIPATVLTGFLGSGKTTMIRHLVSAASGRRLAFIINEFGDLGVDRELIRGCGLETCADDDIVELANGCICCTVADDFLPTMRALIERPEPPDHIIIETSGLALPKPLIKAFTWPEVKTRVTVDGVIAVIDARAVADGRFADDPDAVDRLRRDDVNLDHESPLEEVFEEQVLSADVVVLNKTDLVDDTLLEAVRQTVDTHRRPGTRVIAASGGAVDPLAMLGIGAAAEDDLANRPSHHDGEDDDHDHDDFTSFTITLDCIRDPDALERSLVEAVEHHDILRIKGFLHVAGKPMRHVIQGVGPRIERYYDRPWKDDEEKRSELVVIGLNGLDRHAIASEVGGRTT
ncbi:MAG: cobalamin biosynthesis protein CobW [Alphaproteobacteria bacterium]|nr:cobalamin biosynthesis protein CobW [Alphaproteobacteria bacterium]